MNARQLPKHGQEKHGASDKYVLAAIVLAIIVHLAVIVFVPRQRIHEAMDALSAGGMQFNHWAQMERLPSLSLIRHCRILT